jgi:hypothetical protein
VVLQINKAWLFGALVNHIASYAGNTNTPDVNQTFMQRFVAYTWKKTGITFNANTQDTYSWVPGRLDVVPGSGGPQQGLQHRRAVDELRGRGTDRAGGHAAVHYVGPGRAVHDPDGLPSSSEAAPAPGGTSRAGRPEG